MSMIRTGNFVEAMCVDSLNILWETNAQRLVTITDFVFTASGALLLIITGEMMASSYGEISNILWLSMGLGLFIASGVIWVFILIPVQIKQAKLAKYFSTKYAIPEKYWTLSKYWAVFGVIAAILPLVNLYVQEIIEFLYSTAGMSAVLPDLDEI